MTQIGQTSSESGSPKLPDYNSLYGSTDYQNYDLQGELINTLLASISLDLFLSGSELVHKLRLWHVTRETKKADAAAEGTEMTTRGSAYVAPQQGQPMRPLQPGYQGQQQQQGRSADGYYWA